MTGAGARGQFRHLADQPFIQSVAWCFCRNVGKGFGFPAQPGIAALIDVARDEEIHDDECDGDADSKGHGRPHCDAPGSRNALRFRFP